jgi:hypothetical protein
MNLRPSPTIKSRPRPYSGHGRLDRVAAGEVQQTARKRFEQESTCLRAGYRSTVWPLLPCARPSRTVVLDSRAHPAGAHARSPTRCSDLSAHASRAIAMDCCDRSCASRLARAGCAAPGLPAGSRAPRKSASDVGLAARPVIAGDRHTRDPGVGCRSRAGPLAPGALRIRAAAGRAGNEWRGVRNAGQKPTRDT